ncbi:DNA topoisomerase IV subunit A [Clostridium botulinum]|uniref:DNA topoisomerase IV subunit A n=1 Tax=Clostridium botulinum TaxID=1491 RepID=UPI000174E1C1|nr:DNA topoisomerase IV subunit A [Clostridium botulinum]ACD51370.1 DNA gyrase subunit A [Clostridium botulinum E3 str. Alaska E43]AJF28773.1 DNA topoisomerase IV subunit A [Clostridium botulinum]AJF31834.1 DNA topoisomerase IV subunit A [Clostridium botulinum]MBY6790101.1 DNA topoisomerase IV subunit A [Clostridium botulinum]MBY6817638.1 DNA topoisomerase IV subunit A [Clostridium botulinum]
MAKKVQSIPRDNNIIKVPLEEAMPENYLPYAIEVAKERALPDVRDGLKPVHRRILYGAYLLKAFPDRPYYKSARIVGDILGKFHPHGDSSVYDAMTILAQNFSTRAPLIDGHGNWGSIDGDSAAAMRYTEARLAPISMEMLRDIDKDTVDMVPNYSDSEFEPKVLPSRYPNLLVNGSFGIAVGLATNIPPHNLKEVTDGVLAYIDNNEIDIKELMEHIKGPDLPTGGILIGKNSLRSAYESGVGKVAYRAKTNIEKLDSGRIGIAITEFPYRRNKAKLLQTISEMTGDRRHSKALELISDIRDESDRNGIRAVIELKKSADEDSANKILKYLFKKTELQCNISFNMVALADGKPETMSLKDMIRHYVNHQKEIVTRRSEKELEVAKKRFHIVEGFIKAIDVLDEVIAIIRSSKSKKDASNNLIEKFAFTAEQAQAILELMLYRLTGLEIKVFEKEYKELEKIIKRLEKILSNEKELLKVIKFELKEISDKYGDERKTNIIEDDAKSKIDIEELIIVEEVMITLSKDGFIKRIPVKNYIRSNSNPEDIEYREGDKLEYLISSNTRDSLLIFTDKGFMYQVKGINIPELKWKEKGERLDTIIKSLNLEDEKIVEVISVDNFNPNKIFRFITKSGGIKESSLDKFETSYGKLQALKLRDKDALLNVKLRDREENNDYLNIKTKLDLEFTIEVPELENVPRNILPIQLFNLSIDDEIIEVNESKEEEYFEFNIGINDKNILKYYKTSKVDINRTKINSSKTLLLFSNKGYIYKIPGFLLKNIMNGDIKLEVFTGELEKKEKIIRISSISSYNDNLALYSFSKKGLVKKTLLNEFKVDTQKQFFYKLKTEDDEVISVDINNITLGNLIIITKKGMAIRFPVENVNSMGKVASGVTGISLREEDEVIFGAYVSKYLDVNGNTVIISPRSQEISLISKANEKLNITVEDIKLQNRAGRGTNVILMIDDELKDVMIV